jgi:hypothetical protein
MGTTFSEFFCNKKSKKVSPKLVDERMYSRDHNSIDWTNIPADYPIWRVPGDSHQS